MNLISTMNHLKALHKLEKRNCQIHKMDGKNLPTFSIIQFHPISMSLHVDRAYNI